MESTQQHINKFREERIAKEKARIEKLRQLNLQKYSKHDIPSSFSSSTVSLPVKSKSDTNYINKTKTNPINNNFQGIGATANQRMSIATTKHVEKKIISAAKNSTNNNIKNNNYISLNKSKVINETKKPTITVNAVANKNLKEVTTKYNAKATNNSNAKLTNNSNAIIKNETQKAKNISSKFNNKLKPTEEKKSQIQTQVQKPSKNNEESVFDRLYKPKVVQRQTINNALRLQTDPTYLKKVIKDSRLIMNKRHTVCNTKPALPVRRSISAVHFKRISKSELENCMHKWASVGEKINKEHLKNINEDDGVKEERVISAIKSERKRVKFQTPLHLNFNTPKPEELQSRLQKWLQKRGKSIDSYHHLQCFGLHHLSRDIKQFNLFDDDDENKENVAIEHDSDNDSYLDNMNNVKNDHIKNENKNFSVDKWRRASVISDSVDFNESYETTLNSEVVNQVDELLLGALNDLTELLKEGFDWEQCARWLRAIRDRYPHAPDKAAYWECRAALEERRGDLPASVQCWEQAIAAGTEQSIVEENLDHLLDKFMQLKISPNSGKRHVDPKLVDVKNVFKSTIIRFAVQQAKLRQSNEAPKYTVTPVRRSSRLSAHWRPTPLKICTTIHQATEMGAEFKPNKALAKTP